MEQTLHTASPVSLSTVNKAGLVLAFLLGLIDVSAPLIPSSDSQAGPPSAIVVLDVILGVLTVVTAVIAWRTGRRGAIRLVAGARIISAITALPAFFVDVPAGLKATVGVFVVLTVVAVVMMLAPRRQPQPVTD
jgi:hypothetical protein